jgi:GNAT superfamily N-acetyltransferase
VAEPGGGAVIRKARAEDLPQAMELFDELDRLQRDWRVFEPRPDLRGEAEARYRRALEEAERGRSEDAVHVVAEMDGRIVGMAFAHLLVPSSMSDELAAELSNVIVRPDAWERGVGRALVAEIGRWATGRGVRRVMIKTYAQNEEALRFWEAIGFEPRFVQMTARAEDLASG